MQAWSPVERTFLAKSGRDESYAGERLKSIEVKNVYELGVIVSLSFMEWVRENPTGVVALPTGRTPEYFIKTLERFRNQWGTPSLIAELRALGFEPGPHFPPTSQLTFVMLDEFFPMPAAHRNSFTQYIHTFYVSPLGILPANVLHFDLVAAGVLSAEELEGTFSGVDVDLGLLQREATSLTPVEVARQAVLLRVQAYCDAFEGRVRAAGGIGFFLGGIGPDGHVAFNQEGGPHDSRTRLVSFNYPTAAAAAGDLGGIEIARGKAAMTIGLATITSNPGARIIIMAAGEGKAEVVRAAIEDAPSPGRPASCLHSHSGARLYLTHGAASALGARRAQDLSKTSAEALDWAVAHLAGADDGSGAFTEAHLVAAPEGYCRVEALIYGLARRAGLPVHALAAEHLALVPRAGLPPWVAEPLHFRVMCACASRRLREKIEAGLRAASPVGLSILHTAPHHDDIMLSYHGAMHEMLGRQPAGTAPAPRPAPSADPPGLPQRRPSLDALLPPAPAPSSAAPTSTATASGSSTSGETPLGEAHNGNLNYFAYLTSGFHSVNDAVLKGLAQAALAPAGGGMHASAEAGAAAEAGAGTALEAAVRAGHLSRDYDDVLGEFRAAFAAADEEHMAAVELVIFLRKVAEVWSIQPVQPYAALSSLLAARVAALLHDLASHRPGDAVGRDMQLLKGAVRETEVDRVWALSRMPCRRTHHMRSKFYTDDFFCPTPSLQHDALPLANLIRDRRPGLVTVALDPEGTGPDTHYKVLQVVAAALRLSLQRGDLQSPLPPVWGYRNVWFVFQPTDATLMIPVSLTDLDLMHATFMACFATQRQASYPSPSYEGPFSLWAKHLQVQQREAVAALLGEEYLRSHPDARVRGAGGFVFLRALPLERFLLEVEGLKERLESAP